MPIGQRKISTSDITLSTAPQTVVESNNAEFNGLSDELTKFMQEGQLSGKGWESAKKLAGVYETITHTFQMVSDQLMQANAEVKNTSGLIGTQIDEAAIEDQISSNKAAMTTLSYSNTIWNSTNPGVANQDTSMATANNNYYITSLTNQNNELQKVIDGLNGYDSRTKSVYDEVLDSLNKLESLMKQVSDSSKTYNAKTGLFTTDGIDMKIVSSLDDTYNNFEGYKTLAKDLGISEDEAIALCKKYKVSPNDDIEMTSVTYMLNGQLNGTKTYVNKTTEETISIVNINPAAFFYGSALFNPVDSSVVNVDNNSKTYTPEQLKLLKAQNNSEGYGLGVAGIAQALETQNEVDNSLKTDTWSGKGYQYVCSMQEQKKQDDEDAKKLSEEETQAHNQVLQNNHAPTSGGTAPNDPQ